MRLWVRPLASLSGLRICAVGCGVGYRCGSDPELLWLWCRPAAVTPIGHLAWEPPYATGAALKKTKKKKRDHLTSQPMLSLVHLKDPSLRPAQPKGPIRMPECVHCVF